MDDVSRDTHDEAQRVLVFGEVLFDRFPDGSLVLGGAPFNVAWNLRGLGADPLLISRVGADDLGARILAAMNDWEMEVAGVQSDPQRPTGTVEVSLADGEPAFDIVADRAYDWIDRGRIPSGPRPLVLYHGSLACRSGQSRAALAHLIASRPHSVFLDVNLRPPWWQEGRIHELLRTASEVKMNEDELSRLVPGIDDLDQRARDLVTRFGVERLHVTRGAHGAITFQDRGDRLEIRPSRQARVVDTVGAGDAFSSVLLLGSTKGWSMQTTLERAQAFAQAVVGLRGATTAQRDFYEGFTQSWSEE